jgi:oxygen-independent coproporphyrinogen-3 oxidase
VLSEEDRRVERILLELRLREGVPLALLREEGLAASRKALADGLLEQGPYDEGRGVLTLRGRLLADGVVRDLVD